jgi:hypothetical protein
MMRQASGVGETWSQIAPGHGSTLLSGVTAGCLTERNFRSHSAAGLDRISASNQGQNLDREGSEVRIKSRTIKNVESLLVRMLEFCKLRSVDLSCRKGRHMVEGKQELEEGERGSSTIDCRSTGEPCWREDHDSFRP